MDGSPPKIHLYAGSGSTVNVKNLTATFDILGGATVNVNANSPFFPAEKFSVESDPANPQPVTLNVNTFVTTYTMNSLGGGTFAIVTGVNLEIDYQGAYVIPTFNAAKVTINDSGAAGTQITGFSTVTIKGTDGPGAHRR